MKKIITSILFLIFGIANIYLGFEIKNTSIDTNQIKFFFSADKPNYTSYTDIIIAIGILQAIIGLITLLTKNKKNNQNFKLPFK